MNKYNILYYSVLKYQEENLNCLKNKFNFIELMDPSYDTDDILETVDVILAPLGYFVSKEKIDKCPRLKVIASNTTGHPHIDIKYAESKGITVITLKNKHDFLRKITPTAELTWGLIIAITRNIIPAYQFVMQGKWDRRPFGGQKMLSRMTLGVVGIGRLGKKIAHYGLKFGMNVVYYDPYVSSGYPGLEKLFTLEELVSKSDVITVHVPHENETEGMFSEDIFSKFKKGSYFINTSRGELVDHIALLRNLESGHIAGAAIDVFENEFKPGFQETISSHPLWKYAKKNNNLILTPHIAGSTYDAWHETEKYTIDSILETLSSNNTGKPLPITKDTVWAIIPARGGSKTIPLKNIVELYGEPLINYSIKAGRSCSLISRIVCSTDSEEIIRHCEKYGVEIQNRPDYLAKDNVSTVDVILYFLNTIKEKENNLPEFLVLLEPTSPFVQATHIEECISALKSDSTADSAQTVTRVSSNSHAYNQRYHDENGSNFLYVEERETCINKQLKPEFFIHGNVRVMRVGSVIRTRSLFGDKSIPIEIPRIYAMDVDGPDDLLLAKSIIKAGILKKL